MKIVTGHGGTTHITSNDFQGFNQGVVGRENYVLNVGTLFRATLLDATHIQIEDGEGVMQGVHFRIPPGEIEEIEFDGGVVGMNRNDLIVARYTKDEVTEVEAVELAVVKGVATSGTAVDPEYISGDILGGDALSEYPLYRIALTGVTPEIVKVAGGIYNMADVVDEFAVVRTEFFSKAQYKMVDRKLTLPANGVISSYVQLSDGGKRVFVLFLGWVNGDISDGGAWSQNVSFENTAMRLDLNVYEGGGFYPTNMYYTYENHESSQKTITIRCLILEVDY